MAADTTTEKRFLGLNGTKALVAEIKKKININVLTTKGDILYATSDQTTSNGVTTPANLSRLAIGTAGQVLKVSDSGVPAWGTDNDSNVSQNSISDGNTYNVLLRGVTGNTSGTGTTNFNANVKVDTSTSTLMASKFSGNGASLTNLNATNLATGTVNIARLPSASPSTNGSGGSAGIISGQDLEHLQTMWGLWAADGEGDTLVNKVQEVLNAFADFSEGNTVADLLANKANASDLNNYIPLSGTNTISGNLSSSNASNLGTANKRFGTVYSLTNDTLESVIHHDGGTDTSSATITIDNEDGLCFQLNDGSGNITNAYLENVGNGSYTIAYKSDIPTISLATTAGSEAITVNNSTLNLVTRDTTQIVSGAKTFTSTMVIGDGTSSQIANGIYPGYGDRTDLGKSDKRWHTVYAFALGTTQKPADYVYSKNVSIFNASGTEVAELIASGIKIKGATASADITVAWDTLALISNGEITAADVQAMF